MKNNIKHLRKLRGLTMVALAELVGTSQQQIDRLEKGKRKLSAEWIDVLCKTFNCKPGELVEFAVDETTRHSTIATATAEVIGAIETKFGNNVREFDAEEKYEMRFKPAAKDAGKKFFALVVEGGNYLNYPEGTELILAERNLSKADKGLQESEGKFASNLKNPAGMHKFVIGSNIVQASIIKSIRSE